MRYAKATVQIPLLDASQFCHYNEVPDGLEHAQYRDIKQWATIVSEQSGIDRCILQEGFRLAFCEIHCPDVAHLTQKFGFHMAARVWARAFYLMGYREGNPESEKLTP